MAPPPAWFLLLFLVSFFGVGSWYIRNFSQRLDLLKVFAFSGVISMVGLLFLTWRL